MTAGTRRTKSTLGGRFSITRTGISRSTIPARSARITSSLANTSLSTRHASTIGATFSRRNALSPWVSVPRKPKSVRSSPL
jgi:hypothetical protein